MEGDALGLLRLALRPRAALEMSSGVFSIVIAVVCV